MTVPGPPARWPARGRRVFPVLIVLMLAVVGWAGCAGTEVWSRIEPVDDAALAGTWAGPGEAGLVLGPDGDFHASRLPASAFQGGHVAQLDGVDARWTRERRDFSPDAIRVRFDDASATELIFDVRRSWRGRPELVLWTSRCLSCRQRPVTFVHRS